VNSYLYPTQNLSDNYYQTMATLSEREQIARLVHRFGFGPKPGEFEQLLALGLSKARNSLLTVPQVDIGLSKVSTPVLSDLGKYPRPNTPERLAFAQSMRSQSVDLTFWWLDRMVLADNCLTERMVWFWHGHWATSIGKVDYALPMKVQNETLRKYALGDFSQMSRTMVEDGALLIWLDAQLNTAKSPNENLARELMELFTLGVGKYSEVDVKSLARGLTGYQVTRSTGESAFLKNRHDSSSISFLGTVGSFTAPQLSDYLVSRSDCQTFIPARMWFRFISTSTSAPTELSNSFSARSTGALVNALANHVALADPINSQVKSPVEWFASVCRALNIVPSKLTSRTRATDYLGKLGQVPFAPPNVGGWPFDEAWLNTATAQYRIALADYLISQGDLTPVKSSSSPDALANWLGVGKWSARTQAALIAAGKDPSRIALLAICSPEYLVSA
jgi:uncharacterized protein (DUF1800 family)